MRAALLLAVAAVSVCACAAAGAGAGRLVCYTQTLDKDALEECTHVVYTGDLRGKELEDSLKEYKKYNARIKVLLRVKDGDQTNLRALTKSKLIQGLELSNLHSTLNRTNVQAIVESTRSATSGPLYLSLPPHPELLAKYYDLRSLVKIADLMVLETHELGVEERVTYHPSRLSGVWDMMNTDSVVDLAIGLGVPASKLIISLPATAYQFTLTNETLSTPGSPTVEDQPKVLGQEELCGLLSEGKWTLERDQDLSAPYAFRNKTWVSFEDASSIDVKGKYARVRGLAGLALQYADRDAGTRCGPSLRSLMGKVLNQQSRAPRAAVLRSLEQEILSAPYHGFEALQVSPYRITQVVDSDGLIHSIREDSRTEFSCSRQGYFVHPRSCARFYRCVKFDQTSPDFTVFEFDCPSGLAFDSRHEVCVWPGSLPGDACVGSSEIAPVPRSRFLCPAVEGYYADPENCRWFFACLDHGSPHLTAYEFRCPFGLGFDEARLVCDWPWLVPACGNVGRYEQRAFGHSAALLTGAAGFAGQSAAAINVAAHQSLISGASLNNQVGLQHFLSPSDRLDANFISSQELSQGIHQSQLGIGQSANFNAHQSGLIANSNDNNGFVQPSNYEKYTSGSLILDEYRLPTAKSNSYAGVNKAQYANVGSYSDNSGAYVHDPSGDYAEPYRHVNSPVVPYIHDDSKYKNYNEYQDYGLYTDNNEGRYVSDKNGQYDHGDSGAYKGGNYAGTDYKDYSSTYKSDAGKYIAGVYHNGVYNKASNSEYLGSYGNVANEGYVANSKVYTGASHALTAGAVNVGLVGKTTLVESPYRAQENAHDLNYHAASAHAYNTNHGYQQKVHTYVSQPAVSITHVGTDSHNLDGYEFHTTPTTSGIPTTATPFAVTTQVPTVTYKTTFVPEPPQTNVKQIFYSQPPITHVKPTVVPVTTYVPKVQVTDYNQAVDHQIYESKSNVQNIGVSSDKGYVYEKPKVQFEEGVTTYSTTPAPAIQVTTFKPQGFSHGVIHQSQEGYEYARPLAVEEPFKKVVAYTTGPSYVTEPSVPSYSQSIIHQTVHDNDIVTYDQENLGYQYNQEIAYKAPKTQFNSISHQTIHSDAGKVDYAQAEVNSGYHYNQQEAYEPKTQFNYVTVQPTVATSTYSPPVYTQIVHKVDASQVNTNQNVDYSGYHYEKPEQEFNGYRYAKPVETFVETPRPVVQISTVPTVTYKPQTSSHQTVHTYQQYVPSTTQAPLPKVQIYQQPSVTVYENPILKYAQKVEPITYVKPTAQIITQTYQPIIKQEVKPAQYYQHTYNQGYSYNQPEIQQNIEVANAAKYSQANEVSHQVYHLNNDIQYETRDKDAYVSTTPSTVTYEDRYYEAPKEIVSYKAPEYIPPKAVYQESYVSSTPVTPLVHNSYVSQTQDQSDYKGINYEQQYELSQKAIPQVAFTTTHEHPKKVSYHVSSYPGSTVATIHQSPEIQVGYQEYQPPPVSYKPVTSTYRPTVSSTLTPTPEYDREYLQPRVQNLYAPSSTVNTVVDIRDNEYIPPQETYVPVSTTSKPIVRYEYTAPDYLPPKVETSTAQNEYLPPSTTPREYLPPVTTTYLPPSTTPREYLPPRVKSTYLPPSTTPREYLPPRVKSTYLPSTSRPVTSTTPSTTTYNYVESTTFKAPEYLPPQDEHVVNFESFGLKNNQASSKIKYNPYQIYTDDNDEVVVSTTTAPVTRKQNIVVQHAKSNLLGFGTVGPDAGLVSPVAYTTSRPISTTEDYTARSHIVTSTYPSTQRIVEVTSAPTPARRLKPKVAVVTKINDFNPLLVRKLGAVCSCQTPIVVLRGRRPNESNENDYDYSAEYDDSNERGDVAELIRKVERGRPVNVKTVTTTTFNPIIVPDDSYYDDYLDQKVEVTSKKAYSENYISSTPAYSTTERIVKIRPRQKSVTVAPTYKTVILESASSTAAPRVQEAPRGRDDILAGIECQKAGLFRHPKHCNKFYACRWDCTKQRFTLHTFNCPVQLSFDPTLGACNWPSQGPACQGDTLLSNTL